MQESGLVLVIVLLAIYLAAFGGNKNKRVLDPASGQWTVVEVNKFLDIENLVLVAKDASFIAIMAVGMTAVIVLGGIDLSVGSIYALAALVGAMALRALQSQWLDVAYDSPSLSSDGGAPAWAAILVGIGVCCLVGGMCGAVNGALVVGLRVHPFVITLGTMTVLRGAVAVTTQGLSVSGFPGSFSTGFFKAEVAGVYPVPVIVMCVVAILGHFILTRTVIGRRTFAIGGNETAAGYAGVPVGRVKVVMYSLMGVLAGLSASVYLGYLGAASPDAGQGYELSVIAAAVIGGASLSGGRGSALGAVLGAILVQLIDNAIIILEGDQNYNKIIMGTAIVVAVVLDQMKTRFTPRGR
ncbi:D-allose transport system permease protein AlsC [Phycisphaerales bacterium]|nr:D-allose transport system permease protein AlsC [Phycisphaerales bacterium]